MIEIVYQAGPRAEHAYLAGYASTGPDNAPLTDEKQ